MAGKNGGRRPGAGRKPGVPQGPKASTIRKAEAREAHRRVIEKFALRMIRSQVAAAIGIGHVYTRDQHGKFTRIENEAVAHQLLTGGTEGKDYWIFMKDPSTAAFTDLMNRAFDKPKEQEQDVTLTHDGSLVIRIESRGDPARLGRAFRLGRQQADSQAEGRCRLHGGVSTGPRTPEGLEAIRRSRTIHGFYCRSAIEQRHQARAARRLLAQLLAQLRT